MRFSVCLLVLFSTLFALAQNPASSYNDPDAAALLQKVSEKYKSYKNISSTFKLVVQKPKVKPEDNEKKLTDTLSGKILLEGNKFNLTIKGQQIVCDGKNVWTYIPLSNEVQVNYFEESDDILSPTKIFTFYTDGYSYQLKEKKTIAGKQVTVVEISPSNKKVSYFKIDVAIDEATLQIVETKIYQKSGMRYVYMLTKQTFNTATTADSFVFDASKHPGVKITDLR
ncbi:MAG: outer membrane lipoprotein carrier protein LolA [Chitinophagales bacterium]|nr:outer membrane lipoprotein carrier protein LolA [Chitinophagales bacterium]